MSGYDIAVLGYGLRVPGASTPEELWDVVAGGRDVVHRMSSNVGVSPGGRVHAYGTLADATSFDDAYFGCSPAEARAMDPQQRLLLECAVEALERSSVPAGGEDLDVGVYVATGLSSYLLSTYRPDAAGDDPTARLIGGDGHYAATRIAFHLGLLGPAVAVGSACSSSLVAVHVAAQALLAGECDVALAGGVDVEHPQPTGYVHQEGGIMSRTGVCRPFAEDADGVVFASGGGVVALAPLATAREHRWPVLAVLRGTAINNDGASKASFTAPSPRRQADVVAQALSAAQTDPAEVRYVECHGTATRLGDRSELDALAEVLPAGVALGSVKANMGHLRVGAGVVGLVKACEVVRRGVLPPLANTTRVTERVRQIGAFVPERATGVTGPLVAGVSSFGFGGTNAHAVVASPPAGTQPDDAADAPLASLRVSAPTPEACLATAEAVGQHLAADGSTRLVDAARALSHGRASHAYRAVAVGGRDEVVQALRTTSGPGFVEGWAAPTTQTVVLLPGQGSDVRPLVRALHGWEPRFTAALDDAWRTVRELVPDAPDVTALADPTVVLPPAAAQAALVAVPLALWEQLAARGASAERFVGYSLGEYTAAVLAGALDRDDALRLVVRRAELVAPAAGTVRLVVVDAPADLHDEVAATTPRSIRQSTTRAVYAVPAGDVAEWSEQLTRRGAACRDTGVAVPYHTPLLQDQADELRALTDMVAWRQVAAFVPGVAGVPPQDAGYLAAHLETGLDYAAAGERLADDARLVDLDPAHVLAGALAGPARTTVPVDARTREEHLLALARLWVTGVPVATGTAEEDEATPAVLPTTRFQRVRHEEEPSTATGPAAAPQGTVRRQRSLDDWMYYPSWRAARRTTPPADHAGERWLVLAQPHQVAWVAPALRAHGVDVVTVTAGHAADADHRLAPGDPGAVGALLDALDVTARPVDRIVHLWCSDDLDHPDTHDAHRAAVHDELERGFYTLLYLVQQLAARQAAHPLHLDVVARGIHPLDTRDSVPERALLSGPTLVVPQDMPFTTARSIDVVLEDPAARDQLVTELRTPGAGTSVVLTGTSRWLRTYERDRVPAVPEGRRPFRLRDGGVYLVTGGVGGIGMTIADYLVSQCSDVTLVLTGLDVVPTEEMVRGEVEPSPDEPLLVERTARIRALVERGARVVTARCDAADLDETRALIARVDSELGGLHGVVHAAGVFETQRAFRGLEDTGPEDCSRRLLPKVDGTFVLAECLRGRRLDFLLMQSSLSSHLGGLGFYAYTAGNAYMDAFAERHRTDDLPWMSVNWDGWVFGDRDDSRPGSVVSPSFASPDFGVVAEIAIRPDEGAEIYGRLMDLAEPRLVLVSTAHFPERVGAWVTRTGAPAAPDPAPAAASEPAAGAPADLTGLTGVQAQVAQVWTQVLGVTDLGPDSNFFAVGGDSLRGVALAHTLSRTFGTVLSAITLFDNPTVAAMARCIEQLLAERGLQPAGVTA